MICSAVIAAAGLSSRMHEFKPMMCLGNDTMIVSVIQNLRNAGIEEIVVVTGYKSDILQRHLRPFHVRICENERYAETRMYDSIRMGLQALRAPCDGVFLTPADVPLVQPETMRRMKRASEKIVRPICQGKAGHPVLVAADLIPALLAYDGRRGLRGALESFGNTILDIEVNDIGILMDADTPEDLKALRHQQMVLRSGGNLWPDIQIHISKSEVVLTPETTQFLEMIEHTGSIQSACACMHMSYTRGWKLLNRVEKELGYPLVERIHGGTSGGGSCLSNRGKKLLWAYQSYRSRMKEFADQLFVELFPEELNGNQER